MNKTNPTSLAKKLTVVSIMISAGTMILTTGIVFFIIVSFGDIFLKNELDEKSEFIQKSFSEPIWTFDQNQIDEIGKSLIANDKYTFVSAIKIETITNELLFEKKQEGFKDQSFESISKLPYTQSRKIKIFKGTQEIGVISVAMTNYGYVQAFRDQFLIILGTALLLLLALTQLVRYYFNQTLTKPMNKILDQVHQIENENYEVLNFNGLPEELESISRALNQASLVIEKRNNDIMYYTNDLERLVKERTSELEDQMAKNLNTARLAAVGEMAADVAHEINNPLTVIDLLLTKLKRLEVEANFSPEIIQSVDKIQGMTKRMVKIIKGLKSLSRDGNADPVIPFSITAMVEDVKMLVEMKLKSQDICFTINLSESGLYAIGREVQISQVLVNLIGNAIDAVMGSEDKWISLDIVELDDEIEFCVTDCGNGIPELLRDKIMRPFFTTKAINKGTGLGLSISKNIIEEHGKQLIYNENNEHTQFIFSLKKSLLHKLSA